MTSNDRGFKMLTAAESPGMLHSIEICLAILLVTFFGWLSDLLERLSDLQLRNQMVILNHLVVGF